MRILALLALILLAVAPAYGAACSTTAYGSTSLEKAANGLAAGEWCEMTPAMLNFTQSASNIQDVLDSCGEASNVAQYANNMAYDPSQGVAGKIWWWGSAHGGTYRGLVYDVDDNEFVVGPVISGECHAGETTCQSDWETSTSGACSSCSQNHANDGVADDNNGNFYRMTYNSTDVWKITLPSTVTTTWEDCPTVSGTGAMDFWPDYGTDGTLVTLCGGYSPHDLINFYDLNTSTWSQPFSTLTWTSANSNINNMMNYNAGSGELWVTEGDGPRGWRIYLNGGTPTLSQQSNAPVDLGDTAVKAVDDPIDSSGKFVVWSVQDDTVGTANNGWYEYDLGTDTWTTFATLGISSMPPLYSNSADPGNMSVISVSVPEYGVSVWLSHEDDEGTNVGGMFIYKHSTFDTVPACQDGTDNDGDGMIDLLDPSCADATDDDEDSPGSTYETDCKSSSVIRCYGFEDQTDITTGHPWSNTCNTPNDNSRMCKSPEAASCGLQGSTQCWDLDTSTKSSGKSALRFEIPDLSSDDTSGAFSLNFTDDYSNLIGEGEEFYLRFRYRVDSNANRVYTGGDGYKVMIVGAGDTAILKQNSCTSLETVFQTDDNYLGPYMYHNCGNYDRLDEWDATGCSPAQVRNQVTTPAPPSCCYNQWTDCGTWANDTWMTLQIRVEIGTFNDGADFRIQGWLDDGSSGKRLIYDTDILNGDLGTTGLVQSAIEEYGKVWFLPYNTNKDNTEVHTHGYVWYDDLIISTSDLWGPSAGVRGGGLSGGSIK